MKGKKIFPSKTKFFEGRKSKFAKIKNLHLENIGRKVCAKFGERRSNRFRIKSGELKEKKKKMMMMKMIHF